MHHEHGTSRESDPLESMEYEAARLGSREDFVEISSGVSDVGDLARDLAGLAAAMRGRDSKRNAKKIGTERATGVVVCPFAVEDQEHLVRQIFEIGLPNPQPLQGTAEIVELETVRLKGVLGRAKSVLSLSTAYARRSWLRRNAHQHA